MVQSSAKATSPMRFILFNIVIIVIGVISLLILIF